MKRVSKMISRDGIYFLFIKIFRKSGGNMFTVNTLVSNFDEINYFTVGGRRGGKAYSLH